ncbi:hypothetical protein LVJ94_30370 [Pendulispora rubella]|uniref:Secreted protein n=1 Tax=Pendulispora rubella TaxID=2741070 RepID=A0ABZ2KU03_9BACT
MRVLAVLAFLISCRSGASVASDAGATTHAPTPSVPLAADASNGNEAAVPLADLVATTSSARAGYGLDATGEFICQEDSSRRPEEENAGCDTADGYEVHARVEYRFAPDRPPETYAIEPLRAWRLARCGAVRTPVTISPALRRRVAPGLATQPSHLANLATSPDFVAAACRDPRLAVRFRGVHHTFVPPTVHRFELDGAEGSITLRASGHEVSDVRLKREAVNDGCSDTPQSLPLSLDLEVICSGTWAVVTTHRWRVVPMPSCLPRGGGTGPRSPAPPRCTLSPRIGNGGSADQWISTEAWRALVHLDTGARQPVDFTPVDLRP